MVERGEADFVGLEKDSSELENLILKMKEVRKQTEKERKKERKLIVFHRWKKRMSF